MLAVWPRGPLWQTLFPPRNDRALYTIHHTLTLRKSKSFRALEPCDLTREQGQKGRKKGKGKESKDKRKEVAEGESALLGFHKVSHNLTKHRITPVFIEYIVF